MTKHIAIGWIALWAASASAQPPTEPPPQLAPPPPSADPAGEDAPPDVLVTLVLGLQGRAGVGADTVRVLNDLLTFELGKAPGRRVLGMNDIKSLLEAEAAKQLLDCNAQSCLAELAGAVDADRVVYGSVEKIGRGYFLIVSEIDARTIKPVARAQRRLLDPSPDRLTTEVPSIVDELLRGGSATAETGVLIVTADSQVEIVVEGRGYGGAPAVIEDAPVGDVTVVLFYREQQLTVSAPVYPARVTTVSASLDALVGDVSPEEAEEALSNSLWAAGGGGAGLAGSIACCLTAPCGIGALGCCIATPFGSPQLMALGGQADAGWVIGSAVQVVLSVVGFAAASATLMTAPLLLESDLQEAHVIEIAPPSGEGEPRTIELDAKTGQQRAEAVVGPRWAGAVRY